MVHSFRPLDKLIAHETFDNSIVIALNRSNTDWFHAYSLALHRDRILFTLALFIDCFETAADETIEFVGVLLLWVFGSIFFVSWSLLLNLRPSWRPISMLPRLWSLLNRFFSLFKALRHDRIRQILLVPLRFFNKVLHDQLLLLNLKMWFRNVLKIWDPICFADITADCFWLVARNCAWMDLSGMLGFCVLWGDVGTVFCLLDVVGLRALRRISEQWALQVFEWADVRDETRWPHYLQMSVLAGRTVLVSVRAETALVHASLNHLLLWAPKGFTDLGFNDLNDSLAMGNADLRRHV